MYLGTRGRLGRHSFERFDHIATSRVCIGMETIGRAEVEIEFLFTKTRWGIMADTGTPAAIIYMEFDIQTPKDSALRTWEVQVSLQENISDKPKPKDDKQQALRFTDFYGPKQLRGRASGAPTPRGMMESFRRRAEDLEALKAENHHTGLSGWEFKGQRFTSSPTSPFYDILAWEMENSGDTAHLDRHPRTLFHVAFAIQHNAHEFYLKTSVTGTLGSTAQDTIRRLLGGFKDSNNEKVIKFQFPSRASYLSFNTLPLDALAKGLEEAMTRENTNEVPLELALNEPQQLPLEFTESPSYPPSRRSSPDPSAIPGVSTDNWAETPPAFNPEPQQE